MARWIRFKNLIEDDRGARHAIGDARRRSRVLYWFTGRRFAAIDQADGRTPHEQSAGLGRRLLSRPREVERRLLVSRRAYALLPQACLICAYDLDRLAADGDGCTVCPECGAAWRLPLFSSS